MNKHNEEYKRVGYWEEKYNNGNIRLKGSYVNGQRNGYWEIFHSDGSPMYKGTYDEGQEVSYWETYDYSNNVIVIEYEIY